MVRTIVLAGITLLLAVPAFAQFSQDDYPKIEMAMGYANLGFPSFSTFNSIEHHSGFSTHMACISSSVRFVSVAFVASMSGKGKPCGDGARRSLPTLAIPAS